MKNETKVKTFSKMHRIPAEWEQEGQLKLCAPTHPTFMGNISSIHSTHLVENEASASLQNYLV